MGVIFEDLGAIECRAYIIAKGSGRGLRDVGLASQRFQSAEGVGTAREAPASQKGVGGAPRGAQNASSPSTTPDKRRPVGRPVIPTSARRLRDDFRCIFSRGRNYAERRRR